MDSKQMTDQNRISTAKIQRETIFSHISTSSCPELTTNWLNCGKVTNVKGGFQNDTEKSFVYGDG